MNSTSLVPYGERMAPTTNKPLAMFINQVSCLRIPTYPLGFSLSFLSAIQFLIQNMPSFSVSEETLVSHTKATTSKILESVDTIPPASSKRERTLVLCFDGTGDQ